MNNLTNSSGNIANTTQRPINMHDLYSSTERIVGFSLVYGIIATAALAGNIMVFIVMSLNRTMHTATNVLLLNLSLSDIFFLIFAVPGALLSEVCNYRWVLGEPMAKLSQFFSVLCSASSTFTMVAIAFERYLAVVQPLKHMARKKKTTVITAITIIWLCAVAMAIPFAIYTVTVRHAVGVKTDGVISVETVYAIGTTMKSEASKIYFTFMFVLLNVIPFLLLSFFYACIVWRLWNPDRQLSEEPAGALKNRKPKSFVEKARRKTTTMLIVVLLAFVVCQFPYNIFVIIRVFVDADNFDKDAINYAASVLTIFLVLNSATNPIIYNFLSEKFRRGFRNIFSCHFGAIMRVGVTADVETVLA